MFDQQDMLYLILKHHDMLFLMQQYNVLNFQLIDNNKKKIYYVEFQLKIIFLNFQNVD